MTYFLRSRGKGTERLNKNLFYSLTMRQGNNKLGLTKAFSKLSNGSPGNYQTIRITVKCRNIVKSQPEMALKFYYILYMFKYNNK